MSDNHEIQQEEVLNVDASLEETCCDPADIDETAPVLDSAEEEDTPEEAEEDTPEE